MYSKLLLAALPLSTAASLLGAEGHGVFEPACCSTSTAESCVSTHPCRIENVQETVESIHAMFDAWIAKHGKVYDSIEEFAHRLTIFAANLRSVREHDAVAEGYEMSADTPFADLTTAEFEARQKLFSRPKSAQAGMDHALLGDAPASKDWRDDNIVNPVKDQGSCGSCWTFSAVVSIEGQHAKKTGKLVSLSEQNLVDCVKKDNLGDGDCCDGCSGGLMDNAFDYMIKQQAGGIVTEDSYPYTGKDGTCSFSASNVGASITNYTDVPAGDEDALLDAVGNVGPVSIALDASKQWQMYSGGIMTPRSFFGCSTDPNKADHGVAIVGYGEDNGSKYWWIRNSWGASWGESGYMRLARGVNACGIANFATYPTSA